MAGLEAHVATRVLRGHRNLRRRLPELAGLAGRANGADPDPTQVAVAERAVRFLDRTVLAHADVEDALLHRYLDGQAIRGSAARLQPQHDTLREASSRLHDFLERPTGATSTGGLIRGVCDLLRSHLDDEWQVLMPALATLDGTACGVCQEAAGNAPALRPTGQLHLPVPFESAVRRLSDTSRDVPARASTAATTTVRRLAQRMHLPRHNDLGIVVHLVPAVLSPRIGLFAGQMRSGELGTVVSPVDFEVVLSPRDGPSTHMEVHHVVAARRPVPPGVPARELAEAAIHPVIGELAHVAGHRTLPVGLTDPEPARNG